LLEGEGYVTLDGVPDDEPGVHEEPAPSDGPPDRHRGEGERHERHGRDPKRAAGRPVAGRHVLEGEPEDASGHTGRGAERPGPAVALTTLGSPPDQPATYPKL